MCMYIDRQYLYYVVNCIDVKCRDGIRSTGNYYVETYVEMEAIRMNWSLRNRINCDELMK